MDNPTGCNQLPVDLSRILLKTGSSATFCKNHIFRGISITTSFIAFLASPLGLLKFFRKGLVIWLGNESTHLCVLLILLNTLSFPMKNLFLYTWGQGGIFCCRRWICPRCGLVGMARLSWLGAARLGWLGWLGEPRKIQWGASTAWSAWHG